MRDRIQFLREVYQDLTLRWNPRDSGQLLHGALGAFVLNALGVLLGFGVHLILTNVLSVPDYGTFAYALSWAGILVLLCTLGLDTLLLRQLAVYRQKHEYAKLRGILLFSDRVAVLGSVMVAGIFAFFVAFISGIRSCFLFKFLSGTTVCAAASVVA